MRKLSIKGLIVAVFALILAMALGATASLLVTDRMTAEALARHERAMQGAADVSRSAAVAETYRELQEVFVLSTRVTLAVRISTFLIGLVLAVVVYRRVAQMVAKTAEFAGRIERGDFAARFEADAGGETATLAEALNRMVDRLRAAAEHEAAASRRLAFLIDATPTVIYAAKATGDHATTYISPNVARELGWTPEDFTGNAAFWPDHLHPEDRERMLAQMDRLLAGDGFREEYRFRHRDGSWRWMHDEATLVRDDAGAAREMIGSWIDVTAHKALEASLARRDAILNAVAYGAARFLQAGEEATASQWALAVEAALSHLGEATGVSRIWIAENAQSPEEDLTLRVAHRWTQPEFALASDDPLFAQTLSYRGEGLGVEALRLRRGEILPLRPRDLPESQVRARFERLGIRSHVVAPIMLGKEWWGFIAFDDCREERPWSEIELEALRVAAGLFGAAVAARTGREALRASLEQLGSTLEKLKRQGAEIERQNAELAQASRMKSEFLAAITHELKTPLNGILGFAELLEAGIGGALPPEQKGYAGEILGAGKQLLGLVNRLLELARLDAGKTPFLPEETEIGGLLREAAQAHAAAARARGIAIAVEVDADEVEARVDARLLRRLLDELIDNAIKFNREGGAVTLRTYVSPSPRPSHTMGEEEYQVFIEVLDSGVGISAEDQARLFQPFVQLDGALNRQYAGTGLGLALARRIAALHGSDIAVDSAPGGGSRFVLRLDPHQRRGS